MRVTTLHGFKRWFKTASNGKLRSNPQCESASSQKTVLLLSNILIYSLTLIIEGRFVEEIPEDTLESRFVTSGMPNITPDQTRQAIQFIEKCLALDPADRPTIAELKNNPWLKPGFACSCGYCG